jgi:hypothetical protein
MERQTNCEPGLLTPPKRRKTAAASGNWRATASQNLNQLTISQPGRSGRQAIAPSRPCEERCAVRTWCQHVQPKKTSHG